jgi:hypothetical protein
MLLLVSLLLRRKSSLGRSCDARWGEVKIQFQGPPELVEPAVQQVEQKAAAQPVVLKES